MINQEIDNRYTILEHVGGGGMADVYRAHDKLLDRSVAIKVLRAQFTHDEEFIARFRREAQAAAKLSHPNIVNIYDVGLNQDLYYIVMEYVSGETLKERIQREGRLPVEAAVHIALQIAEGLEHAHQNNLVHCDIKPHNILITRSGRVKVADFGIARAVTSATVNHTGTIIGSVHYFSPEQAHGTPVSAKSDIYSLGVVLYEMLTGAVPFNGETPISIALQHIQEQPVSPRKINTEIPPLIEATVLKAMAKDPAVRFADIGQMIADLRLAQNYLRDAHTRKLANDDFPTQVLPKLDAPVTPEVQSAADQTNAPPAARKRGWGGCLLVGLFTLLLLGSALTAFFMFGNFWSGKDVKVPNVVGQQADIAQKTLTDLNLRVTISNSTSDSVPAGCVISQSPEADSVVKEQRVITLVVSHGKENAAVPDLRGLNYRDAELQIKNTGFTVGRVTEQYAADVPPNTIIGQNPRPPAQAGKNTPIDLIVSKAEAQHKMTLPDFRGTPLTSVTTQLESAKLKVGKVTEEASDRYPAGTVTSQNPAPGAEVAEGAAIDVTVAKNVARVAKRAIVQFTVPAGAARQNVQITLTDDTGQRVVYSDYHKPGDKISKQVEGIGQARVQVYINGVQVQEQTM